MTLFVIGIWMVVLSSALLFLLWLQLYRWVWEQSREVATLVFLVPALFGMLGVGIWIMNRYLNS